jgi:hypothetical protein
MMEYWNDDSERKVLIAKHPVIQCLKDVKRGNKDRATEWVKGPLFQRSTIPIQPS